MCRLAGADELLYHVLQLLAQEYGDDSGRRLVCAQTVVVANVRCGLTEQVCVCIDSFQDAGQHQQELKMLMGCGARIQQVDAIVCGDGPVVVLTGTIHACEGLLMKQALQSVTAGHHLQGLHNDLVVVYGHIALGVNRCQLMLRRSHLIVLGLGCHAQLPQLLVDLLHESCDTLTDVSEVMVIQLLSLGRHGSEQGPASVNQVFSLQIFCLVYQEVLLLRSYGRSHSPGCGISEETQQSQRFCVDGFHGT